jgi:threonyl-tRNA synthetase
LLKESDEASLKVVRHSAAHVMATAILELFPETKLGHGPATDAGSSMTSIARLRSRRRTSRRSRRMARWSRAMRSSCARKRPREKGLTDYAKQGEFMKVHFIEHVHQARRKISLYRTASSRLLPRAARAFDRAREGVQGDVDCGCVLAGDEKNQQLQRIYGTAFFNAKDLDAHFKRLEEIKARDHRVLGKQLDLFSIQEVAGRG